MLVERGSAREVSQREVFCARISGGCESSQRTEINDGFVNVSPFDDEVPDVVRVGRTRSNTEMLARLGIGVGDQP